MSRVTDGYAGRPRRAAPDPRRRNRPRHRRLLDSLAERLDRGEHVSGPAAHISDNQVSLYESIAALRKSNQASPDERGRYRLTGETYARALCGLTIANDSLRDAVADSTNLTPLR